MRKRSGFYFLLLTSSLLPQVKFSTGFLEVIVNSEKVRCGFATNYIIMLRIDLSPLLCYNTLEAVIL